MIVKSLNKIENPCLFLFSFFFVYIARFRFENKIERIENKIYRDGKYLRRLVLKAIREFEDVWVSLRNEICINLQSNLCIS